MRIIDLSHTIESSPQDLAEFLRVDVSYSDHQAGAREFQDAFGIPPRLFRNGEGPAGERLSISTHAGTHLDAPYHYNSVIQGQPSPTIDELPLEWFFGPGVVVDAHEKADGDAVTAAEIEHGIHAAGHPLAPGDIVLVHTGRDAFYGVRVMGIDAWGWDAPLDGQAKEALERDEPGIFWAAHQVDLPYSQIERLTNLSALPPTGFTVACFPLKIKGASAGLSRVVAILDA
jgi:kynurenine formamidase